MKRFVVAYISFHDNELVQYIYLAEDEYSALKNFMIINGMEPYDDLETVESLKQFAFDCDSMVSAIEV